MYSVKLSKEKISRWVDTGYSHQKKMVTRTTARVVDSKGRIFCTTKTIKAARIIALALNEAGK